MSLVRTKDRETITLTNFTFAEGEVTLIHPQDIPYQTYSNLLYNIAGLEEYVEFSLSEGVTSPEDFVFLMELTTAEAAEFQARLGEYLGPRGADLSPGGDSAPKLLSPADEQALSDFVKSMGGMPDAVDPFDSDEDSDEDEGDDGLASI